MPIGVTQFHHIQILVPRAAEQASKRFYGEMLGLEEIPKPERFQKNGGAWYRLGANEIHLSLTDHPHDNATSRRHICLMVADLARAERALREAGLDIIPDTEPFNRWTRFFVRDPGDNRVEIAQLA